MSQTTTVNTRDSFLHTFLPTWFFQDYILHSAGPSPTLQIKESRVHVQFTKAALVFKL